MNRAPRSAITKEERQEARRARILEAASELFKADGAAGLNIRAIAARAGMPAMTLYGYFPSKTDIVRALWAQAFAPLPGLLDAAEAAPADPKTRLLRVSQALVDYWIKFPDRYRIIYLIEDRREGGHDRWFVEEGHSGAAYLRFGPLIAAARGDPEGRYVRDAEGLICGLIGIAHLLVTASEYRWADSATYVEMIVRGFY